MAANHILLVHFPIALLTVAMFAIILRAFSGGTLARAVDHALVPLLAVGVVTTAIAYAIGFRVWPAEAITSSPLGRNHILSASWTLAYWAVLLLVRWRGGEAVWDGLSRWVMVGLALLGSLLLTITGTLGGHLTGTPTAASQALRAMGWEVYTTFYVPDTTLYAIGGASLALLLIALAARRARPG
ncbi:hypothetical protein J5Y09_14045 [Roseomonas sp. PWR1]|uniref:DUF2231 domain-containing protein n=1 Tax=Roseomonas nitratireducens TaxID=2820810 RepID=A0ABS4AW88_9PROT|nr:DUF2231 domain-containing protein [Neoroseomonas nitratireducens]MBP0465041.1 hypothetical protein [Neoroseomonas nitratireducens]